MNYFPKKAIQPAFNINVKVQKKEKGLSSCEKAIDFIEKDNC